MGIAKGTINITRWDSVFIYISRCAVYYMGDEMVGRAEERHVKHVRPFKEYSFARDR